MEGVERLRIEIVKSAVDDYRKALKKSDRIGEVCKEQLSLENWFLSPWGQQLSGDNGELIIEKCRSNYKNVHNNKARQQLLKKDTQRKIYEEYINGVKYKAILERYKISSTMLYNIVKRWEK